MFLGAIVRCVVFHGMSMLMILCTLRGSEIIPFLDACFCLFAREAAVPSFDKKLNPWPESAESIWKQSIPFHSILCLIGLVTIFPMIWYDHLMVFRCRAMQGLRHTHSDSVMNTIPCIVGNPPICLWLFMNVYDLVRKATPISINTISINIPMFAWSISYILIYHLQVPCLPCVQRPSSLLSPCGPCGRRAKFPGNFEVTQNMGGFTLAWHRSDVGSAKGCHDEWIWPE
jgi:hypothetical protein